MAETLDLLLTRAAARRRYADSETRKRVRQAAGVTQLELAEVLGIPKATMCNWEQGHTPTGSRLTAYLDALERLRQDAGLDL